MKSNFNETTKKSFQQSYDFPGFCSSHLCFEKSGFALAAFDSSFVNPLPALSAMVGGKRRCKRNSENL